MSEYLYCITRSENPDCIEICASRDDPREDTFAAKMRRREMGQFLLHWTLPVVDMALSEAALRKALLPHRHRKVKHTYSCDPMEARGEAVRLTTLRARKTRKKPSLLRRLIRAA